MSTQAKKILSRADIIFAALEAGKRPDNCDFSLGAGHTHFSLTRVKQLTAAISDRKLTGLEFKVSGCTYEEGAQEALRQLLSIPAFYQFSHVSLGYLPLTPEHIRTLFEVMLSLPIAMPLPEVTLTNNFFELGDTDKLEVVAVISSYLQEAMDRDFTIHLHAQRLKSNAWKLLLPALVNHQHSYALTLDISADRLDESVIKELFETLAKDTCASNLTLQLRPALLAPQTILLLAQMIKHHHYPKNLTISFTKAQGFVDIDGETSLDVKPLEKVLKATRKFRGLRLIGIPCAAIPTDGELQDKKSLWDKMTPSWRHQSTKKATATKYQVSSSREEAKEEEGDDCNEYSLLLPR